MSTKTNVIEKDHWLDSEEILDWTVPVTGLKPWNKYSRFDGNDVYFEYEHDYQIINDTYKMAEWCNEHCKKAWFIQRDKISRHYKTDISHLPLIPHGQVYWGGYIRCAFSLTITFEDIAEATIFKLCWN